MADQYNQSPARSPELLSYVHALRQDDRADTFMAHDGSLLLVPREPHDFVYSERMRNAELSTARLGEVAGAPALVYPERADLVTFPAILNAMHDEVGRDDVIFVLQQAKSLLQQLERRFDTVPTLGIQDIAIDRTTGRVELLAPFMVAKTSSESAFDHLRYDGFSRTRSDKERAALRDCFEQADHALMGGE